MKLFKRITASVFLVLLIALTACSGNELPEGMDEEKLFHAGKDVMLLLVNGEYEAVHAMLREDQRALVTVDDIRKAVTAQLDEAGVYKQIDDHMTSGQIIDGVRYGIAVLYCDFSEKDVLIRISFDKEMQLVGFALERQ